MKFESCALFDILISNRYAFLGLTWHRLLIEAPSLLTPTAAVVGTMPAHCYYVNPHPANVENMVSF